MFLFNPRPIEKEAGQDRDPVPLFGFLLSCAGNVHRIGAGILVASWDPEGAGAWPDAYARRLLFPGQDKE